MSIFINCLISSILCRNTYKIYHRTHRNYRNHKYHIHILYLLLPYRDSCTICTCIRLRFHHLWRLICFRRFIWLVRSLWFYKIIILFYWSIILTRNIVNIYFFFNDKWSDSINRNTIWNSYVPSLKWLSTCRTWFCTRWLCSSCLSCLWLLWF